MLIFLLSVKIRDNLIIVNIIAMAKILILKFGITQQFVVKWIAEVLQFEELPELVEQNLLQILIN